MTDENLDYVRGILKTCKAGKLFKDRSRNAKGKIVDSKRATDGQIMGIVKFLCQTILDIEQAKTDEQKLQRFAQRGRDLTGY